MRLLRNAMAVVVMGLWFVVGSEPVSAWEPDCQETITCVNGMNDYSMHCTWSDYPANCNTMFYNTCPHDPYFGWVNNFFCEDEVPPQDCWWIPWTCRSTGSIDCHAISGYCS